jgi:hypothetical protein
VYSKIITQDPLTNIISLADAKKQCRVTHTAEDDYITELVQVCSLLAQEYTRKLLSPGTVKCVVEDYQGEILLPFGNPTTITSVFLDDVETTEYDFDSITEKVIITDMSTSFDKITVEFNAGYADGTIPVSTLHAIKLMISTFYNTREDNILGMTVEKFPMASLALLNKDKYYVV